MADGSASAFVPTVSQRRAHTLLAKPQRHTLLYGGARSTKTFTFTRAIAIRAMRAPESRHLICRQRYNAVRASVWLDTLPKVMRLCFPGVKLKQQTQDGLVRLPNGSEIWFAGLDDKDRIEKILGLEFATVFANECSQIPAASIQILLTRLAQKCEGLTNRAYYDLNPTTKAHWTYRQFLAGLSVDGKQPLPNPEDYAALHMHPNDNAANVDSEYLRSLLLLPTRERIRFFDGQYQDAIDGQLWTVELLELHRVSPDKRPKSFDQVVVSIDPSGTTGEENTRSDEIGLVVYGVKGIGAQARGYVLADLSGQYSPEGWGKAAVNAYDTYHADRVIGEVNYGGDMVRAIVHAVRPGIPFRMVTATRGKAVRAAPCALLYDLGLVHHVGEFPKLEAQMCAFAVAGYMGDRSPDRVDALVWAITDTMLPVTDSMGLIGYYNAAQPPPAADPVSALMVQTTTREGWHK